MPADTVHSTDVVRHGMLYQGQQHSWGMRAGCTTMVISGTLVKGCSVRWVGVLQTAPADVSTRCRESVFEQALHT